MTIITIINVLIALTALLISIATFWLRKSSKAEKNAKEAVSKADLKELESKVTQLNIDISILTERLSNTISQTDQISNKLDYIIGQYWGDKKK